MAHSLKSRLTLTLPLVATLLVLLPLGLFYVLWSASAPSSPTFSHLFIPSAVSLLAFFLLVRHIAGRLAAPLFAITKHADRLQILQGDERFFAPSPWDEVAILGNALNRLVKHQDRQQAEGERREEIYRTLTEFSTELIFWVSPDRMTMYYISSYCEELTGYRQEEFYQDPTLLDRMLHPDYREIWQQHTYEAVQGSSAEPTEFALITRHGKTVLVSHICRPVWDSNGTLRGIRGRFIDITHLKEHEQARKASEEELRLQNSYLRALHETTLGLMGRLELHSLLSAIIVRAAALMNTEHGFIYLANADTTEMALRVGMGYFETLEGHSVRRGEGFLGMVWAQGLPCTTQDMSEWDDSSHPAGTSRLKATIAAPLTSDGEVCGIIGLSHGAEGESFDNRKIELLQHFAELASLALDNALLYDSAKRELEERRRAEEQLRKLSHAVLQSPVSIIITDLNGTIEFANPHVAKLTGYEPDELLGKNPRIFKSGLTSAERYHNLWETILAGEEWRGELQNRKKNGQLYWQRVLISPVRDQSGTITHFIAINEDISDLKIMETQLRHAQKMEAIGQLAGGIAHDFNNILTAIIGYGNILMLKSPEDSPLRSTAEQILAAAERGSNLTKGLLTFSRKQSSTLLRVDLNGIIERITQLLRYLVGDGICVTILLSEKPLPINADGMQMEQVLINLATNARDVMPHGGALGITSELIQFNTDVTSSHGIVQRGRYALLTVSDTGRGMDEETIRRIFDPFYSTKEIGKGTGLGLSIVYGIIKKHNGQIVCSSAPGEGTVFRIYLPLLDETPSRKEDHDPVTRPKSAPSPSIVLADAEVTSRETTKRLLEEFGYTVVEASDVTTAVQKCHELQAAVSLIVLDDSILTNTRGAKALREIRAAAPGKHVILCADPRESAVRQLLTLVPEIRTIAKPFSPKELLMNIREVVHDAV